MPPRSASAAPTPNSSTPAAVRPAPPVVPSPLPPPAPRAHAARGEFAPAYVTRKRLTGRELLEAAGVGLGVGLVCFYVASVWLEREPVLPTPKPSPAKGDVPEGTMHRTVTPRRAAP